MDKKQGRFIKDPYAVLDPDIRWVPARDDLFLAAYEKFLPPLVHKVRHAVKKWRDNNYKGVSETSQNLLNFWFNTKRFEEKEAQFIYYFAQREAIESIIYLYEMAKARDKYELLKFDSSGRVSTGMFPENWPRYVVKMATGSGKTEVAALVIVWSYFHKLYEKDSPLSKNFLLIAPNIIVLNRLKKDFEDQRIFKKDIVIPENGFKDRNWKLDFQLTVHLQDELKAISPAGNLFLTNVHRVFLSEHRIPSFEDPDVSQYFLGIKPKSDADKSKGMDLGELLRSNKLRDLVILNDEAHHIHDEKLAWFKNIRDINNKLKLKYGNGLSLQADFTATPRHDKGEIFAQTICDYPLVEAIKQNIVKMPVLPDDASRAKLKEKPSSKFVEHYEDYIHLGYVEWKKQYDELKNEKVPLAFFMTTETKESDHLADYLESRYPEFKKATLVIHTNRSGEILERASKKDKKELEKLRKAADNVDSGTSPYKAIVSVLMLREGWDVRNVTTIVGLRPYAAKSNILPEQTLGRGIRKMFGANVTNEELAVIGTPAFMQFVESIKEEGVEFGYRTMGPGTKTRTPIIIEPDKENKSKDLDELDIHIPVLTPRIYREYKRLENIDVSKFHFKPVTVKEFSEEEKREIIFEDLDRVFSHKIILNGIKIDYRSVVSFFTNSILKESRLFSGFDVLYPKVEHFIQGHLFSEEVSLEDPNIIRNLSEIEAKNTIFKTFKRAIDDLTITDKGSAEVRNYIRLKEVKPMVFDNQEFLTPKKSVFNKTIGDSSFELEFANFLDDSPDIISFAKNTDNVHFKMEYQGTDGNIHDYHPDFLVKENDKNVYIVETKGREDLDSVRKIERLKTWCQDVNSSQHRFTYHPVLVKQENWIGSRDHIRNFKDVLALFKVSRDKNYVAE